MVIEQVELKEGEKYFILLTTGYGLFRYHIYDVVRVAGFHNATPLLEFLSKGSHFANLTGEKLSEYQVAHALQEALRELDLTPCACGLAPCWPAEGEEFERPYYGLFLERGDLGSAGAAEALARVLDQRLRVLNVEYDAKRASERLGPVRPEWVAPGFWAEWDSRRLASTGGPPEQYKRPCMINDPQFRGRVAVPR